MKQKNSKPGQKNTTLKTAVKVASCEPLPGNNEELQSTIEELTVEKQEIVNLREQLTFEKEYTEAIITAIPQPLLVLDENFRIKIANMAFYQQFKVRPEDTLTKHVYEIGNGQWNIPALLKLLKAVLSQKESFSGFEVAYDFQSIGHRVMQLNAQQLIRERGGKLILLLIEDSTERVQEEKNRSILSSVVESSDDAIISKTLDGIITSWNKGAERIFGHTPEEVVGKHITMLIPPALHHEEVMVIDNIKKGKQVLHFETLRLAKDGRSINISLTVSPIKNKEGKIIGASKIARDITEQVKARKIMEESEAKYRQLADALPILVWQTDAQGNQTFASKRWKEFTGLDPENSGSFEKMVHPEDITGIVNAWTNSLATGTTYHHEVRLKNKEGEYHWFQVHGEPIYNDKKEIEKWVGAFTDITERKKAEEGIKESEEKFSTLADNMENLAWIADGEGWIYWYNEQWFNYTGTTLEEMQGWGWEKVHHPDHVEKIIEFVKGAWHKNESFELTFPLRRYDGEYRWFLTRARPVADKNGKVLRWFGTNTDITEQKKAEEQFRELADQAPMWVWLTDKEINVLYANPEVLKFIGIKHYTEFTGHIWEQKVHPEDIALVYRSFGDAASDQQPFSFEFRVRNAITEMYEWFFIKGVPRYEANEFAGFIGTGINMNEQKSSLSLLEYRKALLEAHNEASFDGILLVDAKGKILSYNHKFIELWNMPQYIVDARDDEAALLFAMTQLVQPEQFIEKVKWLYEHPDETIIDELEFKNGKILERHGYPVVANDGTYYAWSWTFRDITGQRQSEKIIKESERRFRLLADSMPQHVWTADVEGNLNYFNQTVFDYSGLSLEQIIKDGWIQIVHPDDREENILQWTESITKGTDFLFEHRFKRYDGEYRWQLSRAVPQKDPQGNITMWVGSSTEIQQIKEEEQRKEDFLKMVSHELKTPVTSIKGYVQLLLNILKEKKEISADFLGNPLVRIDNQIGRLGRLIAEMLDLSRLESGKLEMKKEVFRLDELLKETVQDIIFTNTDHTINLSHVFEATVNGDRSRIGQVIINLVNNAIKYSPDDKKIEVWMERMAGNQVAISIKDYGIGIAEEDQEKIFDRFYRAGGESEKNYSGFGIGLFIANQIMQRHDGIIRVESEKDKGSVFTFFLFLSPATD